MSANLTFKEFELLNYLIDHQGETISRKELVELVWDDEDETAVNERTIDVHIRRLRAKIAGYEDIIRTVRGGGYRFDKHPDVTVVPPLESEHHTDLVHSPPQSHTEALKDPLPSKTMSSPGSTTSPQPTVKKRNSKKLP